MATWTFRYEQSAAELEISWAKVDDIPGRLSEYRQHRAAVPTEAQRTVEVYAEATYLKYHSIQHDFGLATRSVDEWLAMRGYGREGFALLEARAPAEGNALAGSLLLRSAWTGDLVVDFVVTNLGVTRYGTRIYRNTGICLTSAALDIGERSGARLLWAETAEHSHRWWSKLLASPHAFIKFAPLHEVRRKIDGVLANDEIRPTVRGF